MIRSLFAVRSSLFALLAIGAAAIASAAPFKPVDTAIKVIVGPLIDSGDYTSREEAIAWNAAGMEVDVIMEKADGTVTTTAVTPTTGGDYDWAHTDQGYYELEIPASGGADYNNTEEGVLTVVGYCDNVLPFKSVSYQVIAGQVHDSINGGDKLQTDAVEVSSDSTAADNLESMVEDGAGGAVLTLTQLRINSAAAGGAVDIDNSGGPGIKINGTTYGIQVIAAGAGVGVDISSTSGTALHLDGASGLHAEGSSGPGAEIGGTTYGMQLTASAGPAFSCVATAGNNSGIVATKAGTGFDVDADVHGTIDTVSTLSGHTVQTGDSYAIVNHVTYGNSALLTQGDAAWATATSVTVSDKTGFSLSAGGVDAIWDEVLAGHTTSDTPGLVLNMLTQDTVTLSTDVALGSIVGQLLDGGTAWTYDRTADALEVGGAGLTAGAVADAVWDEAASGHVSAGTFGLQGADILADTAVYPYTVPTLVATVSAGAVDDSDFTVYQHQAVKSSDGGALIWTIVDSDENAVDLSAKTLQFRAYAPNAPGTVLFSYATGGTGITVGGAENNEVSLSADDTNTATARTLKYDLVNETDDVVIARGSMTIAAATDHDS